MIKNTLTLSIFICLSILGTASVYGDTTQGNEKHLIKELQNEVVVVNVSKPGALYEEAPDKVWEDVVHTLKITGKINSYDLRIIRGFCGSNEYGALIPKNLKKIDLSEAIIVPGGTYYIVTEDQGKMREYSVEEGKDSLLPDKLFFNCSSIESIVIPNNIREVGIGAFYKCVNVKEIVIPDKVTHINSTAFGVCNSLESITLPSALVHLGGYAFTHCGNLKEVTFPQGVRHLHMRMFDQTTNLKTINLPTSLTKMDEEAFFGAIGLEKIAVPEGIDTIPESCFGFCSSLREVTLPKSLRHIGQTAFQENHSLETIHFTEGLKSIGHFAFKNCEKLTGVSLPNSLEEISNEAFINCKAMKNITFGTGIRAIGEKAFFHNHGVTKLTFPASIELIDYAAFAECAALQEVDLGVARPKLVQNPFLGCKQLQKVSVSADNKTYTSEDGVLYSKNFKELYVYPNARADKKLVMNDDLETLGDFSFWFCTELQEVEFPSHLAKLGYRAFCGCSNIKKMTVKNNTPVENEFPDDTFEGVDKSNCQLSVPAGSKAAYKASATWGDFNIVETTTDITSVTSNGTPIVHRMANDCVVENIGNKYSKAVLTDLSGRTIITTEVDNGTVVLHTDTLPQGIYVITLYGVAGKYSIKTVF